MQSLTCGNTKQVRPQLLEHAIEVGKSGHLAPNILPARDKLGAGVLTIIEHTNDICVRHGIEGSGGM